MPKKLIYLFIALSLMLSGGCASKRLAKKGAEHEQAGFYREAASYYYEALLKNDDNLDAKIGLKRTGQQVLDEKLGSFMELYNNNKSESAVYAYRDAVDYYERVKNSGVRLIFPANYSSYYKEVKRDHLAGSYERGYELLMQQKFDEAEKLFNEIYELDSEYKDVKKLLNESRYEPLFIKGKEAMDEKNYRTAYDHFQDILMHTEYKNAASLSEQCIEKGQVTIAILPTENQTRERNLDEVVRARLESKLARMTNPFLKVIDRSLTEEILNEQEINLSGMTQNSESFNAGQIAGAKAFLQSTILSYNKQGGQASSNEKKGFEKHERTVKNQKTGEKEKRVTYEKVTYYEYEQKNSAYCNLSFKLISAETGEILATDVVRVEKEDHLHYAEYEGDEDDLVPGYWKYKRRDSSDDVIKNSYYQVSRLQRLLNASRTIE
ncbi:MAG TPA: CsgG/HfaB family protein, partial [Bacteroidales bacterium]|nr:CsgG/HfaB family protein [Bacteroidales bacterium]